MRDVIDNTLKIIDGTLDIIYEWLDKKVLVIRLNIQISFRLLYFPNYVKIRKDVDLKLMMYANILA